VKGLIAIIQLIIHTIGWVAIILGIVAVLFGNIYRGKELIIGGIGWLCLKYIIGFTYLFFSKKKK